jgi:transcriptional regulator with XRE-family HTH domain
MPKERKDADYNSIFAKRLRGLMEKEPRTTKYALADAIGVTRQSVTQYTDGTTQPNLDKFLLIAKHFNVSADYLLGETDTPAVDVSLRQVCEHTGLSEKAAGVLSMIGKMENDFSSSLSQMLEHKKFMEFLSAIQTHIFNFNLSNLRIDSEDEERFAKVFSCDPAALKGYLREASKAAIGAALVSIIEDIR